MDEIVYIPTIVVGLICCAIYAFLCNKKGQTIEVSVLVNTFLCASGISCGAFLMLSTLMPSLKEKLSNLNLYIFIAGLVVLVVSLQSVYREIKK